MIIDNRNYRIKSIFGYRLRALAVRATRAEGPETPTEWQFVSVCDRQTDRFTGVGAGNAIVSTNKNYQSRLTHGCTRLIRTVTPPQPQLSLARTVGRRNLIMGAIVLLIQWICPVCLDPSLVWSWGEQLKFRLHENVHAENLEHLHTQPPLCWSLADICRFRVFV